MYIHSIYTYTQCCTQSFFLGIPVHVRDQDFNENIGEHIIRQTD